MTNARTRAPAIVGTSIALPAHRYDQRDLADVVRKVLPELAVEERTLMRFFQRVGVQQRYLALPAEQYPQLTGMKARNDAWLANALPLAERAVRGALEDAGVTASQIGLLMSTTITGIAVPSLEARLMNRLPFATNTKRVPLFGLGCLAGAAGIARAAEYLRAFPDQLALFFSVELCSLTVQRDDASVANLISTGLFGDGASAVVLAGAEHPLAKQGKLRVLDSQSAFFPSTERVMGWDVVDTGFKIVLGREVPNIAQEAVPKLVDELLARHDLARSDVQSWLAHPGGPAVMEAMRAGLDLPAGHFENTRRTLRDVGNLSSASVLFLLHEHCHQVPRPSSGPALMIAMGPAFCAEGVLLQ